jgi:hypothetical protein
MPEDTRPKSGTPSKNAENEDSATLSTSQPSTTEEIEARVRRDVDSLQQSDQTRNKTV